MIKLSDIGEFGLIKRFSRQFLQSLPKGTTGIGDDCAIIPLNEKEVLLVTTDMLIEDRHFIRDKITPYELGQKSLMVNLSDIAAMGGTPQSAYLSVGIPAGIDVGWIDKFFEGIKDLCLEYNTYLLGGDTTGSPDKLVINFVVIGTGILPGIKRRSSAVPGDIICIDDYVGDPGGGLQVLINDLPLDNNTTYLVKRHNCPRAHVKEGKWLSGRKEVNAMIDVSDGIESDIHRIMESSDVGAEIELDRIPLSEQLLRASEKYNWNACETGVSGGEDYCLMFTVPAKHADRILSEYEKEFNKPAYKIGRITDMKGNLMFTFEGRTIDLTRHGYDHFRQ